MTTKDIVEKYLIKHGFDGLFDDECGCTVTDLMPCCGEAFYGCSPGYKIPCDPEFCSHGCDFHIGPKKQGEKG